MTTPHIEVRKTPDTTPHGRSLTNTAEQRILV